MPLFIDIEKFKKVVTVKKTGFWLAFAGFLYLFWVLKVETGQLPFAAVGTNGGGANLFDLTRQVIANQGRTQFIVAIAIILAGKSLLIADLNLQLDNPKLHRVVDLRFGSVSLHSINKVTQIFLYITSAGLLLYLFYCC